MEALVGIEPHCLVERTRLTENTYSENAQNLDHAGLRVAKLWQKREDSVVRLPPICTGLFFLPWRHDDEEHVVGRCDHLFSLGRVPSIPKPNQLISGSFSVKVEFGFCAGQATGFLGSTTKKMS